MELIQILIALGKIGLAAYNFFSKESDKPQLKSAVIQMINEVDPRFIDALKSMTLNDKDIAAYEDGGRSLVERLKIGAPKLETKVIPKTWMTSGNQVLKHIKRFL